MSKLTALIVAHNEEAILSECLERLSFADEILVVLDRCTDASKEIALKFGARTLEGGWEIEGARRMAGIDACTGPWILEVDADEWIEAPLAQEIAAVVRLDQADFYFTPIHNYVGKRWVRYGWLAALAPDLRGSLFRKGFKTWGMQMVHPQVSYSGRRGDDLVQGVRHNFVADVSGLIQRFNRNTSLRADDFTHRGEIGRTVTMARKAVSRFWKCYVARQGYREGGIGVITAMLAALYPLVAHLKAQEAASNKRNF